MAEPLARHENAVVGLIPAAGQARRLAPLPVSKELYPIGFHTINGKSQPKVVCHYLLEKFKKAAIGQTYIILRKGKWDIPAYFGDGAAAGIHLAYLIMREPFGPPFSLDQAYPFVSDKLVAFGFPDIVFGPEDVFRRLLDQQAANRADVVLALLHAHDTRIMDMVDIDKKGKICSVALKPPKRELQFTWICALWTPIFTCFMHEYVAKYRDENGLHAGSKGTWKQKELTVGAVMQAGIKDGLAMYGLTFPNDRYVDIGTPEDLVKTVATFGSQSS